MIAGVKGHIYHPLVLLFGWSLFLHIKQIQQASMIEKLDIFYKPCRAQDENISIIVELKSEAWKI